MDRIRMFFRKIRCFLKKFRPVLVKKSPRIRGPESFADYFFQHGFPRFGLGEVFFP